MNSITIIHISDIHRDKGNPISNEALLAALLLDIEKYKDLGIEKPDLLLVSGDIVRGIGFNETVDELEKQYDEAFLFLQELSNELFNGDKSRIVIVPGNHDVNWLTSKNSMDLIDDQKVITDKGILKKEIYQQYLEHTSNIKWSWSDRKFYRIKDMDLYNSRFLEFKNFYEKFYNFDNIEYSIDPDEQINIFDYPEYGITIVGLNSCFHNDHLSRAGGMNPSCISKLSLKLREYNRKGRLILSLWHHNTTGGPYDSDYIENTFIQNLMANDVKACFHGHQHKQKIVKQEKNIMDEKDLLLISAGSLCSGPRELPNGYKPQYNIIDIKIQESNVKFNFHSRVKSSDSTFDNPIWETDNFGSNKSFSYIIEHKIKQVNYLAEAEKLYSMKNYDKAIYLLQRTDLDNPLVRKILINCLSETQNYNLIIKYFRKPMTNEEAVHLLNAVINKNDTELTNEIKNNDFIIRSNDESINYLLNQLG